MPFHIITLKKTKMSRCQDAKMGKTNSFRFVNNQLPKLLNAGK